MVTSQLLSEKAEELKSVLATLSPTDRLGLALYLEDSIETDGDEATDEAIREAWEAELMRRYQEVKDGKDDGMLAEDVHRMIRESL